MKTRREFSRQYLRILARRRRKIAAAVFAERLTLHPVWERWRRDQAFGGHRCRPLTVHLADGEVAVGLILDDGSGPAPQWQWPAQGEGR